MGGGGMEGVKEKVRGREGGRREGGRGRRREGGCEGVRERERREEGKERERGRLRG